MVTTVIDIEHAPTIGAGTLATLSATLAPGPWAPKNLKWTYTEPYRGAKPQPHAKGVLSVTYIPPSKLVGKKIRISVQTGNEANTKLTSVPRSGREAA